MLPHLLADLDKSKSYLIGFSGGADSALLAFLLKKHGYSVRLIHVNHGWSKASADAEEIQQFCEEWAKGYDIPLVCEPIIGDIVPKAVKRFGMEGAERQARYAIFERNLQLGEVLLTGHHLDDSIETVLMNLCRGTSVNGLTGISPESDFSFSKVVRPLSKTKKSDILAMCAAEAVLYRHDRMNDESIQTRNFMRNEIIPLLVNRFGEQIYTSFTKVMENMSECSEIIHEAYSIDSASCVYRDNRVHVGKFLRLAPLHQQNFIYHFAQEHLRITLTKNHIREVMKKMAVPSVLRVNVGGVEFIKHDGYFTVRRLKID